MGGREGRGQTWEQKTGGVETVTQSVAAAAGRRQTYARQSRRCGVRSVVGGRGDSFTVTACHPCWHLPPLPFGGLSHDLAEDVHQRVTSRRRPSKTPILERSVKAASGGPV